jgi:hypothetical protein
MHGEAVKSHRRITILTTMLRLLLKETQNELDLYPFELQREARAGRNGGNQEFLFSFFFCMLKIYHSRL